MGLYNVLTQATTDLINLEEQLSQDGLTDELRDTIIKQYCDTTIQSSEAIQKVTPYLHSLDGFIELAKLREREIKYKRQTVENLKERMRNTIAMFMLKTGQTKLESDTLKVSAKWSTGSKYIDDSRVSDEYQKFNFSIPVNDYMILIRDNPEVANIITQYMKQDRITDTDKLKSDFDTAKDKFDIVHEDSIEVVSISIPGIKLVKKPSVTIR